ncbi:MAG: nucleotidyltransferase domain-containing protein [Deltaproteobacteria bacterium]|nr:nucleotidyltransferase domain-containing protein [Deltaproteobacteria bacterium]
MSELEEKIAGYFKKKKEVIAVYLFGSYAEGKERKLSDIDIGILLDGNSPDFFKERKKDYIVGLGRSTRKNIDPVILNSAGEELLRQVFLKGKCILVKDSKKLAQLKMIMFAKIAEFGYYRSQMQSGLIRKIMEA